MNPSEYIHASLINHGAEVTIQYLGNEGNSAIFQVEMPDGRAFSLHINP